MQSKVIKNLIVSMYYATNNKNITHYVIKHNNKLKHIKKLNNSLQSTYKVLYKRYNCTQQQLNLIQFVYSVNNKLKYTTKYYNLAQRKAIANAYSKI